MSLGLKLNKISIIIPVYRAESFIRGNLEDIKNSISAIFPNNEIIAVIDGFLDRSYEEAKKVEGVRVFGYPHNQGKGFALKYGFEQSTGDFVTFIDCDIDFDPSQLGNFVPYMTAADVAIGSKRHPFSRVDYPVLRKIMSRCFQLYSFIVLGTTLRDTQSGLKLIKREVLEVIMPLIVVKQFVFDLELCFLAQQHGFRIVEVPITVDYQFRGSGVNLRTILISLLDVLAIRYRYSISRYYQKKFWENKIQPRQ
jgi:glycosyltransferase involved in cell wall biosynthesis